MPATTVYTVGHSTRPIEEFLALLREHGIATLCDVRRYPGSRRFPVYSSDALRGELARVGIDYMHMPQLGGRRSSTRPSVNTAWRSASFRAYADHMATAEFRRAVDRLLDSKAPAAIMCAEAVPWRCHRNLISDELTRRHVKVLHILGAASLREHTMNPDAVEDDGHLIYPARSNDPQTSLF